MKGSGKGCRVWGFMPQAAVFQRAPVQNKDLKKKQFDGWWEASTGGPRFRRGLLFKAHRLLHLSTLDSRVIKKNRRAVGVLFMEARYTLWRRVFCSEQTRGEGAHCYHSNETGGTASKRMLLASRKHAEGGSTSCIVKSFRSRRSCISSSIRTPQVYGLTS